MFTAAHSKVLTAALPISVLNLRCRSVLLGKGLTSTLLVVLLDKGLTLALPVRRGAGRSAGRHKPIPGASARALPGAGGPPFLPAPFLPLTLYYRYFTIGV